MLICVELDLSAPPPPSPSPPPPPVPTVDQDRDPEGDDVDLPAMMEVTETIGELGIGTQIACQVLTGLLCVAESRDASHISVPLPPSPSPSPSPPGDHTGGQWTSKGVQPQCVLPVPFLAARGGHDNSSAGAVWPRDAAGRSADLRPHPGQWLMTPACMWLHPQACQLFRGPHRKS